MKANPKNKPAKKKAAPQKVYWHYAVLLAVPLLLYAKTVGFDFVYHDDDTMIIGGGQKLEQFTLRDFLTTDAWLRKGEIELYRPWQSITYAFDHKVAGSDAWFYHLHNIIVFALSVLLLYVFLKRLRFEALIAFLLALLYAVHFLMVHAACWIPARGDLYLVLFGLGALLLLYKWKETNKPVWLVVSVVLFFLAMLSKESGVAFLPIAVLIALREGWCDIKKPLGWWWVLPYAAAGAVFMYLRSVSVYHSAGFNLQALVYNLPTIPEEVFKFFVPLYFSVMPAFKAVPTFAGTGVIVLLCVLVFAFRNKINMQRVWLGLGMFMLMILPSLFYKPVFTNVAYDYLDHRMFACGIGLLIITGEFLALAVQQNRKAAVTGVLILAVVFAGISYIYAENYRNYEHYYQNAISTNPTSGLALVNYSQFKVNKEKKYDEGIALIDKAIALYPDSSFFMVKKCGYLFLKPDYEQLHQTAIQVVLKWPQNNVGYSYMGAYYFQKNNFDSALVYFDKAIALNGNDPDNYFNRAKVYKQELKPDDAVNDLGKALELNNQYADAYFERGSIYGNMGNFAGALADYQQYVALRPDDPRGYFYRGQAFCLTGNNISGCADLQKAADMGLPDANAKMKELCK